MVKSPTTRTPCALGAHTANATPHRTVPAFRIDAHARRARPTAARGGPRRSGADRSHRAWEGSGRGSSAGNLSPAVGHRQSVVGDVRARELGDPHPGVLVLHRLVLSADHDVDRGRVGSQHRMVTPSASACGPRTAWGWLWVPSTRAAGVSVGTGIIRRLQGEWT